MAQKVVVIGAGILGAATAYELQKSGSDVTVIDSGQGGATQASFGWINASFYLDADHFRLRQQSLTAYRGLAKELSLPINWCGALCFETEGAEFDAQAAELAELGYAFDVIDREAFAALVPELQTPPERCLRFAQEAAADSGKLAQALLDAAVEKGAQVVRGVTATRFVMAGDRITGVETTAGQFSADDVVCAVGMASEHLLSTVEVALPMLKRPGAMIRTRPVQRVAKEILVSPIGEIRQLADGSLMMPTAVSHQSDTSENIASLPQDADAALARLRGMFPNLDLHLAEVTLAQRPVPKDNFPVVGLAKDGLYALCAHSGVTLAAVLGQLVAKEVRDGPSNETATTLAPYRPDRF